MELLLETYAMNVDSRDREGYTPLMRASQKSHEGAVRLLLRYGASRPGDRYRYVTIYSRWLYDNNGIRGADETGGTLR